MTFELFSHSVDCASTWFACMYSTFVASSSPTSMQPWPAEEKFVHTVYGMGNKIWRFVFKLAHFNWAENHSMNAVRASQPVDQRISRVVFRVNKSIKGTNAAINWIQLNCCCFCCLFLSDSTGMLCTLYLVAHERYSFSFNEIALLTESWMEYGHRDTKKRLNSMCVCVWFTNAMILRRDDFMIHQFKKCSNPNNRLIKRLFLRSAAHSSNFQCLCDCVCLRR